MGTRFPPRTEWIDAVLSGLLSEFLLSRRRRVCVEIDSPY